MSEAGAMTAFNLFLGGREKRVHLEAKDTVMKPRRELVALFLSKHPEYQPYRAALEPGDDIEDSETLLRKEIG
jgi:hypothetical protein